MPEALTIEGQTFTRVPRARADSDGEVRVYRGRGTFMRTGEKDVIDRYVAVHQKMASAGYPVAQVLSTGEHEGIGYYIEASLGDSSFAELFRDDFGRRGTISSERFQQFLQTARTYLVAQTKAQREPIDVESFASMIHLDLILREMPEHAAAIQKRFDGAMRMLSVPYVLSHGDFNPANMYPTGVIDIENTINAPIGYDAVTAIESAEWFVQNDESKIFSHYAFTPEQKNEYMRMCEDIYKDIMPIRHLWKEFAFCRAIWMTVRMHKWPQTQAYRYEKFVRTYLA